MVMENEIRLGDILGKLTPSDRVVIYNAAGTGCIPWICCKRSAWSIEPAATH